MNESIDYFENLNKDCVAKKESTFFGELTIIKNSITGNLYFIAKEIADILEYTHNKTFDKTVEEEHIKTFDKSFLIQITGLKESIRAKSRLRIITEFGFINLISNSKQPKAEKLRTNIIENYIFKNNNI